jgi:hypothetical protein
VGVVRTLALVDAGAKPAMGKKGALLEPAAVPSPVFTELLS